MAFISQQVRNIIRAVGAVRLGNRNEAEKIFFNKKFVKNILRSKIGFRSDREIWLRFRICLMDYA